MADDDPPRRLVDSLTEVTAGSMIYVDQRGQVRSARAHGRRVARDLVMAGLGMTAATAFYCLVGGWYGLLAGGALTVLLLRHWPAYRKVERATRLVAAERFDEAEPLLRRIAAGRHVSQRLRARAERLLAVLAALRGDHQQALALQTSALWRISRDRRLRSERRLIAYAQVVTLVNLDRVAEAGALFAGLPRLLEGDYLRVQRAYAELYLAFADGRRELDREELRAQTDLALAMPQARAWLTLLAWAHDQMGDGATAARLLAEAKTRSSAGRVRTLFPKLADWAERR